jgi:hypothetical protein
VPLVFPVNALLPTATLYVPMVFVFNALQGLHGSFINLNEKVI